MFQWLQHLITSFLGGGIGGAVGGKVAEKIGEKVGERATVRPAEDHRAIFVRTLHGLEPEDADPVRSRRGEAIRLDREDWMVNLLGRFLAGIEGEVGRADALRRFARLPHVVGLSEEELRREWIKPERSAFLQDLHSLADEGLGQTARRIGKEVAEASQRVHATVREWDETAAPEVRPFRVWLQTWAAEQRRRREEALARRRQR